MTEKEWAVLDDFEGDKGIRGTYDGIGLDGVFETEPAEEHLKDSRPEWHHQPNFKKFKKVFSSSTATF